MYLSPNNDGWTSSSKREKRQMKKKMSQQLGRTRPLPWPAEFRVAYPSMTLPPELVQRMDQLSAAGAIIDTATPLRASRQRVMVPRSPPVEGVSGRGETETHPPRPGEGMPVPRSPPAQTWEPVVATTGQREREGKSTPVVGRTRSR
jgi:hypothetical protein